MMLSAKKQFTDFINTNALFKPSESILLAVSGGKDSVLMATLFAECGFKFAIAHCNFNLRGQESLRDEVFVKELSEHLKVPFYFKSFDTATYADEQKMSIQMAARALRYSFFRELKISEAYAKVAVAHHQNDAIETVLINLIRGTGITGLHGISKNKDDIIRPLLCFTATEVDSIVIHNNIKYVEDSSNASNKYMRNKLRLDVIPQLQKLNPALTETFNQNIAYFSQLEELLKERVTGLKSNLIKEKNGVFKIKIGDILSLHPLQLLLFEFLKPYGFNATQIGNLMICLTGNAGKQFFSNTFVLNVDRELLEISPLQKPKSITEEWIPAVGDYYFNEHRLSVRNIDEIPRFFDDKNSIYVDEEKLIFPLKLRYWCTGDVFQPFGMKGFKKVSDFFINHKIPLQNKSQIPLLVNGNDEIIWVCGFRSDERYKVNLNSKKIITFGIHKQQK